METKTNLYKALAKFHAKNVTVTKSADNPYYKSKYASLDRIIEKIRPHLNEVGIILINTIFEDKIKVSLIHIESGEDISSEVFLKMKDNNDPQKMGSAITYAIRYGITALLCLELVDDDGNAASSLGKPTPTPVNAPIKNKAKEILSAPRFQNAIEKLQNGTLEEIEKSKKYLITKCLLTREQQKTIDDITLYKSLQNDDYSPTLTKPQNTLSEQEITKNTLDICRANEVNSA